PNLSGELGVAFVRGVQENADGSPTGVGACVKHFAANSQERFRMVSDSVVDEQALREIYFPAFERVVREARPAAVMCSYNLVNGVYASENRWLLTDVLRGEWGFEGLVVSDWGATADRVKGLAAGLDLEMPGFGGYNTRRIMRAVRSGELAEEALDAAAERVAGLALTYAQARVARGNRNGRLAVQSGADAPESGMYERHHALARRAAAKSAVLLKNERGLLPLAPGAKLAVIGEFAKKPRYQGAGSSLVNPTRLENAWDEIRKDCPDAVYARGYDLADKKADAPLSGAGSPSPRGSLGGNRSEVINKNSRNLINKAAAVAADADIAVVFAGLPEGFESEGYDRSTLAMPRTHDELIRAVCAANRNTVVVIQAGSPVDLSAAEDAAAILYAWLGGQAGGGAISDILAGRVNPSGRLAETFPLRIEDTPCHGNFSTESRTVIYAEGALVGHRYYEAKGIPVAYPFGHGLSYGEAQRGGLGQSAATRTHPYNSSSNSPISDWRSGLRRPTISANSTLGDIKRTPVGAVLYAVVRFALTFVYGTGASGRRMADSIVEETPLRTISPMCGGLLPRGLMDFVVWLANLS
ncbi:MAG: glycoside hydrolase family 3 C-terminal domain-containing protein, partial [Clostridiales Family XIII bacterium]|nr:glycoside hydrolase family 3 C-terminal domain-containing protein [Clostridiales Family XIII bacterium]